MATATVRKRQPPSGKGLTFEKVWAMFQESDRKFREMSRESDRKFRETSQESDRKFKEMSIESDRKFHEMSQESERKFRELSLESDRKFREMSRKMAQEDAKWRKERREGIKELELQLKKSSEEFNIRLGALTNLFGNVTEAMIAPKICEKFEEFGLTFPRANPNVRFDDTVNNISFEVDIMLENGDKAMLIEAKTKLTIGRVNYHLNRMEKMQKYARLRGDKRIFLGAVAGIVVTNEVKEYALSKGLYFLKYAGDNFHITPPSGKPKEW